MEAWNQLIDTPLGADKIVGVSTSTEHPDAPINDGMFKIRGHYDLMSSVLEKNPNGEGIKYT